MAFNGSGTFSLVAGNPVVTGTTISSTWANNTLSDIANGLTTCVTKDGQTTPTANIPMGTFKFTGLGAGTAAGNSVRYEQVGLLAGDGGTNTWTGTNTFNAATTLGENAPIVLDAALSADGKYSGVVKAGTAGAALAFGELCYLASTGKWLKAKADAASTSSNELGMCVLAAAADTDPTTMLKFGKIRADSLFDTFTVGAPVYISAATAGKVVSTAPTGTVDFVVRQIGQAEDANTVFFSPDNVTATMNASSQLKTVGGLAVPASSPITLSYSSGNQTITSAGLLTLAHGLGTTPRIVIVWLVCTTADVGYSAGDRTLPVFASDVAQQGAAVDPDATNIEIRMGADATSFRVVNKGTGNTAGITNSSWRLLVEAFA